MAKAETISAGFPKVLDEYNLWNAIKMIIDDRINVNTGKKNGAIVKLQQMFLEKGFIKPLYTNHILGRILHLVIDEELGCNTMSPNIEYLFVSTGEKA